MTAQSATVMQPVRETDLLKNYDEEVFDQFVAMRTLIAQRAFEIFERRGSGPGNETDDWLRAENELLHPFRIALAEFAGKYVVRGEVPGFRYEDLRLVVERRRLAVLGERKVRQREETTRTIASEWCGDKIVRVIELPSDIDTARVTRTLEDGILSIELPKVLDTN